MLQNHHHILIFFWAIFQSCSLVDYLLCEIALVRRFRRDRLLTAMGLCSLCSCIPLKLFSSARDKQCTIDHHPSLPNLQASSTAGCELCSLLVHAIQKQTEDGKCDRAFGPCSESGSVTVMSTKFDSQHVQIDHKQAGRFRGKLVPPEWCKDPTPDTG